MTKIFTKYFIATPQKNEIIKHLPCGKSQCDDIDETVLELFMLQEPSDEVVERILLFASQYDAM